MIRNRNVVIFLCVLLCAALGALLYFERLDPEAGSELLRRLLRR